MTQEEKSLLLKDLCARLPYGVKIHVTYTNNEYDEALYGIINNEYDVPIVNPCENDIDKGLKLKQVKPYLRPLSSMTEEEKKEYWQIRCPHYDKNDNILNTDSEIVDWLNKNQFDYRGLIPMGLALEASKDMYNLNKK